MTQKTYMMLTGIIFLIIGLVHLLRAVMGWQVTINTMVIPVWVSWIGLVIAGFLAYQGLSKR